MVSTGPEQDYYAILGVGHTASADDLKHAFRTLARRYHPDVNASPDAERRFEEIHAAYAVLSDPTQRRAYDAARATRSSFTPPHAAGMGSAFTPPHRAGVPPRAAGASSFSYSDLFDEFDDVLASLGAKPRPRTYTYEVHVDERDVEEMVSVTLEEAARGTIKRVTISRLEPCPRCHGSTSSGPRLDTCPTCNGEQWLTSAPGSLPKICPTCNGSGMTFATTCAECGGRGRIRRAHTLAVTIPAGIADGQHIRLAGQGNVGAAGEAPGNLVVTVRIRPHARFRREGDDVHSDLALTPEQLAGGAKIEVETLYGRGMLTIPKGTRVGAAFRLSGKGIPHLRASGRGDQYVHVRARAPGDLFAHVGAARPGDLFTRERERVRGWTRNARRRFGPARRRLVRRVRKVLG